MINKIERIPVTDTSRPFTSAEVNGDLAARGYVEEEYFFSGTANVYSKAEGGGLSVVCADAPYTNRFLVRRPADPAKASGRVVVEILNTSSAIDIDRSWVLTYEQLTRNGDIYLGITSKPVTMKTLRQADPERYALLCWDNPRECRLPAEKLGNFPGASSPETEDGLFWDMLLELGLACREENMFLGGSAVRWVYLMGWSQSGGYLIPYTNYFAKKRYEEGLPPVFDGIYSMAPGPSVTPPLNQEEAVHLEDGDATVQFSSVPYYTLHTESENAHLGTHETRIKNADLPTLRYRIAEIAGATHDCIFSMVSYYKDISDQEKTGCYLKYTGADPEPNNFPYQLAYHAGLMALYDWAEKGIAPPEIEEIPVLEDLENRTDSNGNAVGGWRLPEIELPVCTYQRVATPQKPELAGELFSILYGSERPFSAEKLVELYGSLENYREQVCRSAEEAVEKRLLVAEDVPYCVEHAVKKAEKYGLRSSR